MNYLYMNEYIVKTIKKGIHGQYMLRTYTE